MTATINIAIPHALRDLIAEHAKNQGASQDQVADSMLQGELTRAEEARKRGEALAWYLSHPRLASVFGDRATLNVGRTTNERAVSLATAVAQEIGQKVPKGRVIQALLWEALAPAQSEDRRELPQASAPRDTITVRIPFALNVELIDLAMRFGTSREAVTDELLEHGFVDLAADPTFIDTLMQQPTEPSTTSTATLQVPRRHDAPLQELATKAFSGAKSRALQALLRYGLDRADKPEIIADRHITISGQLYAQVMQITLAQRTENKLSVREFIETAVKQAVERESRRKKR